MKRISLIIAMLMATTAAMLAQKVQKGTYWQDGFTFYHANAIDRDGTIHFMGGSLHEGGSQFALKPTAKAGEYTLAENEPGNEYSMNVSYRLHQGNRVTLNTVAGTQALMFYDDNSALNTVLYKFDGDLERVMLDDYYTIYAGNYVDTGGKKYVFTTDGKCQLSGEKATKPYKIEEMYEIPCNVITAANGAQYEMHLTTKGIDLWHGKYDAYNESFTPDDNVTQLTRTSSPYGQGIWAWASTQLVTPSLLGSFDKPTLRLIRNEIWARHGYRFSAPDLQRYFSAQPWYEPGNNNDAIQLSEIEQFNVDLIKASENNRDDDTP